MSAPPENLEPDQTQQALMAHLRHELRTPLNHIIGYSELLIEEAEDLGQDSLLPDLQKIQKAGTSLLTMLNTILDSSKVASSPSLPLAEDGLASIETSFKTLGSHLKAQIASLESTLDPKADLTLPGRLLVVDDNESNRDMLGRRLERQGHSVALAENGQQALDMMRDQPFDLVLLDIVMPVLDGYQTLARLKADEALRHIPIIMISAFDEMDSVIRCIEMGADDYLSKPFNPTLLQARLGASLDKKRLRDNEVLLFEQVQENYKRLQDLEKLRDDLTHMIVHDLRTPLTSLLSGLQTLEVAGDLNELQQECLEIGISGGSSLLSMINDLLDISKMESGTLKLERHEIEPGHLIDRALQQVASLAKENTLSLGRDVPDNLPMLLADEDSLRRTLVNLLGNAIKFTPKKGCVTTSVRLDAAENALVFAVRDTGEGIPKESFARIFEKFGQVDGRKAGRKMSTGLGLTFCKMVVEAHSGRIWVESEPGKGSVFQFTIPLLEE